MPPDSKTLSSESVGSANNNCLAFVINDEEQEALECLRTLIKEKEPTLVCPVDDLYILRFLRYRKGDVASALASISLWWKDRHRLAIAHDDIYPSRYLHHYERKVFHPLAQRDELGRQVVIGRASEWGDPTEYPPLEMFRSNLCVCDTISDRQLTQLHGVTFIFDMEGLGFHHIKSALSLTLMKLVVSMCEGFPMRIKGFHIIRHPSILGKVWNMWKRLLKKKMRKRIYFHANLDSLHECINPGILPKQCGGQLEWDEAYDADFIKEMMDKDNYYKDLFDTSKYGYETRMT